MIRRSVEFVTLRLTFVFRDICLAPIRTASSGFCKVFQDFQLNSAIMAQSYYNYLLHLYEEKEARKLHRTSIRDIANPFELPDREFHHNYRCNKDMALHICNSLNDDLAPLSSDGYPVHLKVLTSIKFLAEGSYQRGLGQDQNLALGQTTVSKYLAQFVQAVQSRLKNEWINFPGTEGGRRQIAEGFESRYGVPNVLGAIDCTHVKIFPPTKPQGIQYKNRKGVHTLNVQLIADVDCRIVNVNARYPGRVHDQFIFNNSIVKAELRRLYENRIGDYHLIGDSGYGLEPWLLTPILDATPDTPEERYTNWHCRARNTIERTNGYLKGTFRSLGIDRVLHYSPEKASELIYTCCVLYNMMKHFRVTMEEVVEEVGDAPSIHVPPQPPTNMLRAAQMKRANIVRAHFT